MVSAGRAAGQRMRLFWCLIVRSVLEHSDNFIRGHDIPKLLDHVFQRRAMLLVRQCRTTILDHDDLVIELHGIPSGAFTANIGFGPGDEHVLYGVAGKRALQH